MNSQIFKIGIRYLMSSKNPKKPSVGSVMSFTGIFLSVFAIIVILSVFNGFKQEFIKIAIGLNSHINVRSKNKSIDYNNVKSTLQSLQIREIKSVYPIISSQAMIINQKRGVSSGILVVAYDDQTLQNKPNLSHIYNSLSSLQYPKSSIFLGHDLAQSIGVKQGDKVRLLSASSRSTFIGIVPIHKDFIVAGTFKTGMSFYDLNTAILPFEIGRRFANLENGFSTAVSVQLKDKYNNRTTNIARKILRNANLPESSYITTWETENQSFINAIRMQSSVMVLILTVFLLLSIFILYNTISNLISSKTKQIAVFKVMGMSNTSMFRVFLVSGMTISVLAILFGLVLGSAFSVNIESIKNFLESLLGTEIINSSFYFLSYLPSTVYIKDVIMVLSGSLILSLGSIILASYKAMSIPPSLALKLE